MARVRALLRPLSSLRALGRVGKEHAKGPSAEMIAGFRIDPIRDLCQSVPEIERCLV